MNINKKIYEYDVIIIGGGFAGSEAAMASARSGAKTLMLSINMDTIAAMPFGNMMGSSRYKEFFTEIEKYGSAVPGNMRTNELFILRCSRQIDKNIDGGTVIDRKRYSLKVKELLENLENLDIKQGLATDIIPGSNGYKVILSDYLEYRARSVVVCTGTFLNSKIFWGKNTVEGGRPGEIRSLRLFKKLKGLDLKFGITCIFAAPKIERKSINLKNSGLKRVKNNGSEYFVAFAGKNFSFRDGKKHGSNIFILPEGRDTEEMYLYGFENSLSEDIQTELLRRIEGFENVFISRPGYGIKYGCLSPFQLNKALESKKFKGLFFAGKINKANEYEESLAQGLLAGINAYRNANGIELLNLLKEEDPIGRLI
ncbi:MAG: FAD-dependent oxidoreductase [Actinomycetia bacterium]|nr:FAD-dependent oxidoreductase [Actinomycetes bacterium]